MSLTCSCPDGDGDYSYWFTPPEDYSVLRTKRSRRCKSCGAKIAVGDMVAQFMRWREASSDIEIKIYGEGEDIYLADWYFCEACSDQYFNLSELGFCVAPDDNMQELLVEYVEMVKQAKRILPMT